MHRRADGLPRFTAAEKWVHRATGVLVAVLFATGAVLYMEPLALIVGRRLLVEGTHVAAGGPHGPDALALGPITTMVTGVAELVRFFLSDAYHELRSQLGEASGRL